MKYIKTFENQNKKPEVGDYVKINPYKFGANSIFNKFLNSHIGRVTSTTADPDYPYVVKFDVNIPNTDYDEMSFLDGEIEEFAPTIEELNMKLQANKYNL